MKNFKEYSNINLAIIGLGYVGLPLAIEFSKKFQTIGFDINDKRIDELNKGFDRTLEVTKSNLTNSSINFSSNKDDLNNSNVYIVTVPTPVDKFNNPDMLPLAKASEMVGKALSKNDIIIFESTVYPGATEEFCVPILEKNSNLKYNIDFYCGYSPERINPGDNNHTLTNIIKITSGSNAEIANFVDELYKSIITVETHKASSIRVAEAAKIIENIQRDVNIALVNELSMIFDKLNLDTGEILNAAGTKWNFLKFSPGLVGGHCIGVDPYYLTHKAKEIGYNPEMILAGRRINDGMGEYIANSTINEMVKHGINPINSKVAVFGLTFKENCPDLRNTKVTSIIDHLKKYKCDIVITDEFADKKEAKEEYGIDLLDLQKIKNLDVIILSVAHENYLNIKKSDWENFFKGKGVLIDVKSIFEKDFFVNSKMLKHWRL